MSEAVGGLAAALQGRYRIERKLGEGGTATVYLADDLRHARKVALKVLKPDLAAVVGADRFIAEVKTTASLQHPHILPLFDSGEAGGFLYHVTPHVAGESLSDRLDREGQIPVDEAVNIASDVAAALDYAHRNGVIHRDIKPENLLLQDGHPLIADFGIALAIGAGSTSRLTETGISVGTPQYMSPEQATGDQHVGPAADIYALGCVLYEMLAGEPPFTGSTPQAILGKIVLGKPTPLREHRPSVPEHVAGAVAKALEKVPADRFRSGADFAHALRNTAFRWPQVPTDFRRTKGSLALAAAAGAVGVAAVLGLRSMMGAATPVVEPSPRLALSFSIPDDQLLAQGNPSTLEISPDGARIAYVADRAGRRSIFVRELTSFEVRAIGGTEGATSLFFSPDGSRIGFYLDGEIRSVDVAGGIPARITSVSTTPIGVSWGEDGTIMYALGPATSSVWLVNAAGGSPTEIPIIIDTAYAPQILDPRELPFAMWPQHLPGGRFALVVPRYQSSIGIIDLDNGRFRPVIEGNRPYYLPSGHIVFYSGPEELSVVPFDLDRQEVTGPPVVVVEDVLRPAGSEGRFSLSKAGTLVYARGGFARRVVLADRDGRETPVDVEPRGYRFPRVSPDGRWVAVTVDPQPPQIWMIDLSSERAQPISTGGYHLYPVWLRDGSRLAFNTNPGIAAVDWPGVGNPTQIRAAGGSVDDWPLPERMLVSPVGANDIAWLDLANDSLRPWLASPATERQPRTSVDGRWVAYVSDVSGTNEVYVRGFGGQGPDALVSRGGGVEPVWSRDGSEIFYRNGNTILSVRVRTALSFEVLGSPAVLFSDDYDFASGRNWDVLPDGRFVMIRSSPGVGREIRVLTNWLN